MTADPARKPARKSAPRARAVVLPNTLAAKTGPGRGIDSGQLRLADQAVENLSDKYMDHVFAELDRLEALVGSMERAPDDQARSAAARDIYRIVHELRGEAGTFGYGLASRIGTMFCRYVDGLDDDQPAEPVVARHHTDSLRAVITGRITGDGGKVGHSLVDHLTALIKRFSP